VLAYFGANFLYPAASSLFVAIAALIPPPLGPVSGYAIAYFIIAGILWVATNSVLFLTNLRKL
jgi:hypothetical protein